MGLQETPEQQVQTALEQGIAQQQAGTGGGVCGQNMSCAPTKWETGVSSSSNLVNQTAPAAPPRAQAKPPPGGSLGIPGPAGALAAGAGNAVVGGAAFVAGVGDLLTGAAPVWHDPEEPLAPIEAAAAARFNDWKLTPPDLADPATRATYGFTSRAAAVLPMASRAPPGVLLAESEGAAKVGGALAGSRALTPADMGMADTATVQGSFSWKGSKATAKVDYIGAPEGGLGSSLLGARGSLRAAARQEGATMLRIETSRIIEDTGRLQQVLLRAGFQQRSNGTMWWQGNL